MEALLTRVKLVANARTNGERDGESLIVRCSGNRTKPPLMSVDPQSPTPTGNGSVRRGLAEPRTRGAEASVELGEGGPAVELRPRYCPGLFG